MSRDDENHMEAKIWGSRGSRPTPSILSEESEDSIITTKYGGNTSCVELRVPGYSILIDGGTGISMAGRYFARLNQALKMQEKEPVKDYHLLLSHLHWDHIQGIPFFGPAYNPANTINVYAEEKNSEEMKRKIPTTKQALEHQQMHPFFPVEIGKMPMAKFNFYDLKPGNKFSIDGVTIKTASLNHPNDYIGYRFEYDGIVFVYASDVEPDNGKLDENLLNLSQDADLLIRDSQYTPEEYETHRGWGHSHYKKAIDDALKSGVKRLLLFHHDPEHDDSFLDAMDARAKMYAQQAKSRLKRNNFHVGMAREGRREVLESKYALIY